MKDGIGGVSLIKDGVTDGPRLLHDRTANTISLTCKTS